MRRSGPAGLGPRPRGRRGRRGGGYCTFPPGPARSVPTRATERACAASCRAASTPDPAAAASSATEPVITQAANTALKGGGGGGGSCAPALPVPRDPPSDQRRLRGAKKGAAPCWVGCVATVLSSGRRNEPGAGRGPMKSRKRQRLSGSRRKHCGAPLLTHFFFSFNKYILSACYVPGRVVDAEIRARSKPAKILAPSWR